MKRKISPYINRRGASLLVVALLAVTTMGVAAQSGTGWFKFEAESGSLSGQAQTAPDALASNGSALRFTTSNSTASPLPTGNAWTNVTNNLAGMQSACGQTYSLNADPHSNRVIVGVSRRGLWASSNGGSSWSHLGEGTGSDVIANDGQHITFDPVHPGTFWQSGMHVDFGVYRTTNNGNTFQRLGNLANIDVVSVDFTDPNRQTLLAGPHEASRMVWKSTNGGQTWVNIGGGLPANSGFSGNPHIIDSQTYVVSANQTWGGGEFGMFRTTNGGQTWTKTSDLAGNSLAPAVASDGTIYYPGGGGLVRSTDKGLTWTRVGAGLSWNTPVILPDGRLVTIVNGRPAVSADRGTSWTNFGPNVPWEPWAMAYSQGAIYIERWDCSATVLPNAIMKLQ